MNQLDKIFKNKLEHHTVDVPAGSWEHIASRLPEQKEQLRPLVPIMFISFGILVLLGVILVSWFTLPDSNNNKYNKSQLQIEAPIVSLANNTEKSTQESKSSIENPISTTSTFNTTQGLSASTITSTLTKPKTILNSFNKTISQSKNINIQNPTLEQKFLTGFMDNVAQIESTSEARSLIVVDAIDSKFIKNKLPIQTRIKFPTLFKQDSKPAKACPFVFDTRDKSLDVYFSHDFASKILEPNNDSSQSYLNMRNQTERAMYSYSIGARFGYNLNYRWNLHTGLNYSQINEKFEYTDPESNQTRLITIKDYIYENGRIVDSVITEETVIVPGTEKLKVFNKFKSFDIPIIARFTLLANRHMSLSATAGVYLNLSFSQRGMMISENNNTPVDFTSGKENAEIIYKTQLGVSAYGGISLAYHLTHNIDFVLEPHVRVQTESMTVGDYALKQKFNTFGIATGFRYKF